MVSSLALADIVSWTTSPPCKSKSNLNAEIVLKLLLNQTDSASFDKANSNTIQGETLINSVLEALCNLLSAPKTRRENHRKRNDVSLLSLICLTFKKGPTKFYLFGFCLSRNTCLHDVILFRKFHPLSCFVWEKSKEIVHHDFPCHPVQPSGSFYKGGNKFVCRHRRPLIRTTGDFAKQGSITQ